MTGSRSSSDKVPANRLLSPPRHPSSSPLIIAAGAVVILWIEACNIPADLHAVWRVCATICISTNPLLARVTACIASILAAVTVNRTRIVSLSAALAGVLGPYAPAVAVVAAAVDCTAEWSSCCLLLCALIPY